MRVEQMRMVELRTQVAIGFADAAYPALTGLRQVVLGAALLLLLPLAVEAELVRHHLLLSERGAPAELLLLGD